MKNGVGATLAVALISPVIGNATQLVGYDPEDQHIGSQAGSDPPIKAQSRRDSIFITLGACYSPITNACGG
ncbi:MAG: hypothetical protein ACOZDD_00095 [Bacteroidota bacterium]